MFWTLGKCATVVFWWIVLLNLLQPFMQPFSALLYLAGAALLGLHLLEAVFMRHALDGRSHRWFDRLQVLLVGIFHIQSMRRR